MGKDGFGRYPVLNVTVLQRLIERLVEHFGQGSVSKAARVMGLTQPTLYRLHEGMSGNVSHATMAKVEQAILKLDPRLRKQLLLAVMPTSALRLYRRGFSGWCRERALRLVRRRGQAWARETGKAPRPVRERWRESSLSSDLTSTYNHAREEYPDLFARLKRFADRKGIPSERYEVAIVRIVEPLAEYSASAFFEPRWIDLTPSQRRKFLVAGIRREEILMNREHPQVLANMLAAGRDRSAARIRSAVLAGPFARAGASPPPARGTGRGSASSDEAEVSDGGRGCD